jgi:hypothetical protein
MPVGRLFVTRSTVFLRFTRSPSFECPVLSRIEAILCFAQYVATEHGPWPRDCLFFVHIPDGGRLYACFRHRGVGSFDRIVFPSNRKGCARKYCCDGVIVAAFLPCGRVPISATLHTDCGWVSTTANHSHRKNEPARVRTNYRPALVNNLVEP